MKLLLNSIMIVGVLNGSNVLAAFSSSDLTLIVSNVTTPEKNQPVCNLSNYLTTGNIHMQGTVTNSSSISRDVQVFYKIACLGSVGGSNPTYSYSAGWGENMTIPAGTAVNVGSSTSVSNADMDCNVSVCVGGQNLSSPLLVDSFPCESDGPIYLRKLQADGSCTMDMVAATGKAARGRKK